MNKKLILSFGIIAVGLLLIISWAVLKQEKQTFTIEQVKEVKERYVSDLMAINGVVGVGVGQCMGEFCIMVLVENNSQDLKKQIPRRLDGVKVDIEVTGPISALLPSVKITYPRAAGVDAETGLALVEIYFCSDVCPDSGKTYIVFEGITYKEECAKVEGVDLIDPAWGGYIGCAPKAK